MESNCHLSHRVEALQPPPPGIKKAVNHWGGDMGTVYIDTSSQSQLSACGFCMMGILCPASFP